MAASGRDQAGGDDRGADSIGKDEPAASVMADTYEEDTLANVVGYDEEEPGMNAPIKATLRTAAAEVKGGLRPGAGRGPRPADDGKGGGEGDAARGCGEADGVAGLGGSAAASGGYGGGGVDVGSGLTSNPVAERAAQRAEDLDADF